MHNHFWLRPRVPLPVSKVVSNYADGACIKEEEPPVLYLHGFYEETTFDKSSAVSSGL